MISDFHSHILPQLDDGSRSMEESIQMLREEKAQGIERVVATPHFYPTRDSLNRFLKNREESYQKLMETIRGEDKLPDIKLASEVYYFQGIVESEVIDRLTFGKKRCILMEMPHIVWTDYMYDELRDLYESRHVIPVIAHVDRYISPWRTHRIPERLEELPVLVQANANFFLHRSTSKLALRMMKNKQIHLLGSDCHNMTSRPPNLADAFDVLQKNGYDSFLSRMKRIDEEIFVDG